MGQEPLRSQALRHIRDALLDGRFEPGAQIRLAPLAEALSISPTPAREALALLETEGLVVLHPNRGYFAAPLTIEEAQAIYPLLGALEALAVRFQGVTRPEQLEGMARINADMAGAARPDEAMSSIEPGTNAWSGSARMPCCSNSCALVAVLLVLFEPANAQIEVRRTTDLGPVRSSAVDTLQILQAAWSGTSVDAPLNHSGGNTRVVCLKLKDMEDGNDSRSSQSSVAFADLSAPIVGGFVEYLRRYSELSVRDDCEYEGDSSHGGWWTAGGSPAALISLLEFRADSSRAWEVHFRIQQAGKWGWEEVCLVRRKDSAGSEHWEPNCRISMLF